MASPGAPAQSPSDSWDGRGSPSHDAAPESLTFGDAVNFAQLKVEQELANLRRMFRQTQEHRQRSVSEQRKETEQLRRSVQRHKQDTAQLQFQIAQLQRNVTDITAAKSAAEHALRERDMEIARLRQSTQSSKSPRRGSVRDRIASLEGSALAPPTPPTTTSERAAQTDDHAVVLRDVHTARLAEARAARARAESEVATLKRELAAARDAATASRRSDTQASSVLHAKVSELQAALRDSTQELESARATIRQRADHHAAQLSRLRFEAEKEQSSAVAAAVATAVAEGCRLQAQKEAVAHEALRKKLTEEAEKKLQAAMRDADEERQAAVAAVKDAAEAAERDAVVRAVMSARTEYETVMAEWEKKTEEWRRQTIAACEKSLTAARQQISASRKETDRMSKVILQQRRQISSLKSQLQQARTNAAAATATTPTAKPVAPPPVPPATGANAAGQVPRVATPKSGRSTGGQRSSSGTTSDAHGSAGNSRSGAAASEGSAAARLATTVTPIRPPPPVSASTSVSTGSGSSRLKPARLSFESTPGSASPAPAMSPLNPATARAVRLGFTAGASASPLPSPASARSRGGDSGGGATTHSAPSSGGSSATTDRTSQRGDGHGGNNGGDSATAAAASALPPAMQAAFASTAAAVEAITTQMGASPDASGLSTSSHHSVNSGSASGPGSGSRGAGDDSGSHSAMGLRVDGEVDDSDGGDSTSSSGTDRQTASGGRTAQRVRRNTRQRPRASARGLAAGRSGSSPHLTPRVSLLRGAAGGSHKRTMSAASIASAASDRSAMSVPAGVGAGTPMGGSHVASGTTIDAAMRRRFNEALSGGSTRGSGGSGGGGGPGVATASESAGRSRGGAVPEPIDVTARPGQATRGSDGRGAAAATTVDTTGAATPQPGASTYAHRMAATPAAVPTPVASPSSLIRRLPVQAMRRLLSSAGISHRMVLEKPELRRLVQAAVATGRVTRNQVVAALHGGDASDGTTTNTATTKEDSSNTNNSGAPSRPDSAPKHAATTSTARVPPVRNASFGPTLSSMDVEASSGPSLSPRGTPTSPTAKSKDRRASVASAASTGSTDAAIDNWLEAKAPDGAIYYYHRLTRAVRWEKPSRTIAKKLERRYKQERLETELRKQARLNEMQQAEARKQGQADEKERLQKDIGRRVTSWARGKSIRTMLETLHHVVLTRKLPAGVGLPVGGGKSDVKRAYLKTIRVVHPDKVNALPLRQQIESRLVFNTISEAYTKYQEAGPDMNAGRYSYSRSGSSSSRRTTWSAAGSGTASHHRHSGSTGGRSRRSTSGRYSFY